MLFNNATVLAAERDVGCVRHNYRVVSVGQRVFEQISFHHRNPWPFGLDREARAGNGAGARQLKKCCLQSRMAS